MEALHVYLFRKYYSRIRITIIRKNRTHHNYYHITSTTYIQYFCLLKLNVEIFGSFVMSIFLVLTVSFCPWYRLRLSISAA